ncbi:hypothetical protein ABIC38_002029 [Variovorax sp. 1126]|nr:hypothetical protein [Variovorax paradoxus]
MLPVHIQTVFIFTSLRFFALFLLLQPMSDINYFIELTTQIIDIGRARRFGSRLTEFTIYP